MLAGLDDEVMYDQISGGTECGVLNTCDFAICTQTVCLQVSYKAHH